MESTVKSDTLQITHTQTHTCNHVYGTQPHDLCSNVTENRLREECGGQGENMKEVNWHKDWKPYTQSYI